MVRVRESKSFFTCVRCPSICPSRYLLLNHWAEFNQTRYITSPHGKGAREQIIFYVRPLSVHLSVTVSPPKPLGGIQPNMLQHLPSWLGCARATLYSVRPSGICPSGYLLNHWAEFNQTCYTTSPNSKCVSQSKSVRPSCY